MLCLLGCHITRRSNDHIAGERAPSPTKYRRRNLESSNDGRRRSEKYFEDLGAQRQRMRYLNPFAISATISTTSMNRILGESRRIEARSRPRRNSIMIGLALSSRRIQKHARYGRMKLHELRTLTVKTCDTRLSLSMI